MKPTLSRIHPARGREAEGMAARRIRRVIVGSTVAVLAAIFLFMGAGCGSLDKDELSDRLLGLSKNGRVGSSDLERRPLTLALGEETRELELVYLAVAAPDAGDRAPVVLVHGTPSTLFTWVELIFGADGEPGLAAERDVYAIEVVGHGVAPGDLAPYDFQRCADFVNAALETLGLERVHLVGSSYGGEFAWRAALDRPDRIASLALLDASGYPRADGDWLPEEVQMRENGLADLGWLLNSRERIEGALAPHFRTIPPDRVEEFYLVCANSHNWKAMVDLARDENGARSGELSTLAPPTLLLWGADDVAYPVEKYARRFAEDVPSAELVVLPETGHYPHEERPAACLRELTRFFDAAEAAR